MGLRRSNCSSCGSRNLRFSHFRTLDLIWLAMARLPVRCRSCRHRLRLNFVSAIHLHRQRRVASEYHRQKARGNQAIPAQPANELLVKQRAAELLPNRT